MFRNGQGLSALVPNFDFRTVETAHDDDSLARGESQSLQLGDTSMVVGKLSKWKKKAITMSRRERVKREALKETIELDDDTESQSTASVQEAAHAPQFIDEDIEQRNMTTKFLQVFNGKEGPEARMIRLTLTQKIASGVQLVLCIVTFIFAVLSSIKVKTGENTFSDIFCGIVGIFSATIGLYAGHSVSEFFARLFFVSQMWTLYVLTIYIYIVSEDEVQQLALCDPSYASLVIVTGCNASLSEVQAKLSFSILLSVVVVLGAAVTLDFNDAINDYDALRPMLHAHQTAALQVNLDHPNHLSYVKPVDRRAGEDWHLRFQQSKTAPDIEKSFLAV